MSVASAAASAAADVVKVPRESLHVSKPVGWLESRFHFSFADYWDSERESFGALRVLNDDLVKGHSGFPRHPHRDAEIFSYIVDGQLTHKDSMGNAETLSRGAVQYMSAGTGVSHSEMNEGSETCRFLQLWITPDRKGHTPQYGSSIYKDSDRQDKLLLILRGTSEPPAFPDVNAPYNIQLHQDANVYVSESSPGKSFELQLGSGRQMYLIVIEGALKANGEELAARDGARILGSKGSPTSLRLEVPAGGAPAHFLMVEMAKSP